MNHDTEHRRTVALCAVVVIVTVVIMTIVGCAFEKFSIEKGRLYDPTIPMTALPAN